MCIENNAVLLGLECWKQVHPGLDTIQLNENYTLPYGTPTAKNISTDLDEFILAPQEYLKT
ncbi:hypothetical protein DWX43_16110 [Clostridium sp. AF19-22AC]|jgi:hypothetical protein|nr:hypothetical protein DWX43_16110 [Clostridium sp. AF19-22AC]